MTISYTDDTLNLSDSTTLAAGESVLGTLTRTTTIETGETVTEEVHGLIVNVDGTTGAKFYTGDTRIDVGTSSAVDLKRSALTLSEWRRHMAAALVQNDEGAYRLRGPGGALYTQTVIKTPNREVLFDSQGAETTRTYTDDGATEIPGEVQS
jgi:hypothetical protein